MTGIEIDSRPTLVDDLKHQIALQLMRLEDEQDYLGHLQESLEKAILEEGTNDPTKDNTEGAE